MDRTNIPCKVHQCSKCSGDTEYCCVSCPCDMCIQCKENHVKDLKTIDHDVVSFSDEINFTQVPVSYRSRKHRKHRYLDISTTYKTKQQQYRGTIHSIRSEALFYRPVLLTEIKADIKTCHTDFSLYQSEMETKARKLINLIDYIQEDFMYNEFSDFDFNHRCLKHKTEMTKHIVNLQKYVHRYEQSAFTFSALQFLLSIKTALSNIHITLHTSKLSMNESLRKNNVMESLSAIQITERGNRWVKNHLLKLMPGAEFHQSLAVIGVDRCYHISCVTSDRIWISDDRNNLILANTTGVTLHRVENLCSDLNGGLHTVNNKGELIYVDMIYNINKLSRDMKTTTTFIKTADSSWKPLCVYWSPFTGDLLVGSYTETPWTAKVTRYNKSEQLIQTIQQDNIGRVLYKQPNYITENKNGDIVVSDYDYESGTVVVTELRGRHRFSYTGHPSGSELWPRGICTDALSHILVSDVRTNTVHILDRNGQFLSYQLIRPSGIFTPISLSYDVTTHRLWVGSRINNKVVIYRNITRQDALTDLNLATADVRAVPTIAAENPQQENHSSCYSMLKLISPPELLHSFTVTGVDRCVHISCVIPNRVWVTDYRNNLILTNTAGVSLHRVEDLCTDLYGGLHTVSGESELIYIQRNYNINKLSKDMKSTTIFIKRTDSTWKPCCVYWSPSSGDLLVGMYREKPKTGKVTRYQRSGQLFQTIQHDNTGLELYIEPNYITENNNGDIVVSDYDYESGAVVVTECGGRHRFSYTGHPSGSGLRPLGICTTALSHILVCDSRTDTVQMFDKNGQFLSHLLTKSQTMGELRCLSYDINTHCLWVGSRFNNMVVMYKYITRQDSRTDEHIPRPNGDVLCSSTSAI